MSNACPTCGQEAVSAAADQAACQACGARAFAMNEAAPVLASAGIDPPTLRELIQQAVARHPDPLGEGRLQTFVVKGLQIHYSPAGRALWMPADIGARLGVPDAGPAPTPAPSPAPAEDPMASLGLDTSSESYQGGSSAGEHGLPQTYQEGDSGLGLDLDRPAATPKAEPAPDYGYSDDLAPPMGPASGQPPPSVSSESAFAVKTKRVSSGGVVGLLVKVGLLVALGGGGFFAYQEIQAQLRWPVVALDWGYTVRMPAKPAPTRETIDFKHARGDQITWEGEELTLSVIFSDVGYYREAFVKSAVEEAFGANIAISDTGTVRGFKTWGAERSDGAPEGAARGILWIDDEGHAFITMATGEDTRTVMQSNAGEFLTSLRREEGEAPPEGEPPQGE